MEVNAVVRKDPHSEQRPQINPYTPHFVHKQVEMEVRRLDKVVLVSSPHPMEVHCSVKRLPEGHYRKEGVVVVMIKLVGV